MYTWSCPVCGKRNPTDTSICANADNPDHDRYDTLFRRFFALSVDSSVLGLLTLAKPAALLAPTSDRAIAVVLMAFAVLTTVYSIVCHAMFGKTLGKFLLGVKVISIDGTSLSWLQAITRSSIELIILFWSFHVALENVPLWRELELGRLLKSMFPQWRLTSDVAIAVWVLANCISVLSNIQRRAIHDYIARTVVVRSSPAMWRYALPLLIFSTAVQIKYKPQDIGLESWKFKAEVVHLLPKSSSLYMKLSATRTPFLTDFLEPNPKRYVLATGLPADFIQKLLQAKTTPQTALKEIRLLAFDVPYNKELGVLPSATDEIRFAFTQPNAPDLVIEGKVLTDSIQVSKEALTPADDLGESVDFSGANISLDYSRYGP